MAATGYNRSAMMADERKLQDENQDVIEDIEERSDELSDERLDNIAAGAYLTFFDKADGESSPDSDECSLKARVLGLLLLRQFSRNFSELGMRYSCNTTKGD
jgi:hypothetical protein